MINYHSVLTVKSILPFKLLSFKFLLKETLTLLIMLVKTKYCKAKNDIGKYYHWYSQKNIQQFQQKFQQKFQQFQLPAVFNLHEWQYRIFLGLSRSKKILSTTDKFPSNGSLVTLWVKNKCKIARKDTCEMRDVNPPCTYRKLCQSLK